MNNIVIRPDQFAAIANADIQSTMVREVGQGGWRPRLTFITKNYGGVGADLLTSMLVWAFAQTGVNPAVFQGGGTMGIVRQTHPQNLLCHVPLADPTLPETLANFIGAHAMRPAIIMLDPSLNAQTYELLHGLREEGLALDFRAFHVVDSVNGNATFAQAVEQIDIPAKVAMVSPLFANDDEDYAGMFMIPRLPEMLVRTMVDKKLCFGDAMAAADFGVVATLRPRFRQFSLNLAQFYA